MLVEMPYFSVFFHSKDPIIGPITSAIWIAFGVLKKVGTHRKIPPIEKFLKIHSILIGRPSVGSYGLLSLLLLQGFTCVHIHYTCLYNMYEYILYTWDHGMSWTFCILWMVVLQRKILVCCSVSNLVKQSQVSEIYKGNLIKVTSE